MKLRTAVLTLGLVAALAPVGAGATTLIRLSLPEDHSRLVIHEMKKELGRVVEGADLGLRWQMQGDPLRSVEGRIVSVELSGDCVGRSLETRNPGPLGWTKTADGRVLPYIEIDCGRLRSMLTPEWARMSDIHREVYLGKALGRVLAHELAHALTRTKHHKAEGLRRPALKAQDLIFGVFELAHADFQPEVSIAQAAAAPRERDTAVSSDGGDLDPVAR